MTADPAATRTTRSLEQRLGARVRARLPGPVGTFTLFVLKQGWAALFGGLMLAGILLTRAIWSPDWALARYDALVLYAVGLQVAFLTLRLETWAEARVIVLFHLTGTAMELFKVQAGSWAYPEAGLLKLMGVPLFSGFMYAAVGSYMARVIRIFDMRFTPYPPLWTTFALAAAIYVNFFAHHFLPDIRLALFAATVPMFGRTRVWYRIDRLHWMPLPLAALFSALALWLAENVGTNTGTWVYAGAGAVELVSFAKIGSWYLLLYVSFVTVTLVSRDALGGPRPTETPATSAPPPPARRRSPG
ncbi:DUF817 domain-containing protein [Maritimibacter fusiformis]|uniref:DUF817 domain-containing protein n=1 Tax=Maritimibacter fusiformis TaxID=2603819 RepID=A0A5D0RPT3_9RHOB|nr:DUF817 domain-containing protein [Maritimibacter fusiformis]TYB83016.1 DUF817 domain-containing protein [Maritimibacter fusiformis]